MNKDFRVAVSWFTHPKRLFLRSMVGDQGEVALFHLWSLTATHYPKGRWPLAISQLEDVVGWRGGIGRLAFALQEAGLIDAEDEKFTIHNWEKWNKFAYYSKERSEKAIESISHRWKNTKRNTERNTECNTFGNTECNTKRNTTGYTESDTFRNTPSPNIISHGIPPYDTCMSNVLCDHSTPCNPYTPCSTDNNIQVSFHPPEGDGIMPDTLGTERDVQGNPIPHEKPKKNHKAKSKESPNAPYYNPETRKFRGLTDKDYDIWAERYPYIPDVDEALVECVDWLHDRPARHKGNIRLTIGNWLKVQNEKWRVKKYGK